MFICVTPDEKILGSNFLKKNFTLLLILKLNVDMIPWRGDSGLKDGCMEGVDLEGNISKHLFIFK